MTQYLGDFAEDETIYMYFNTFTSDDPSASSTITNFINTDVHIHKDGGLTQRNNAAGITVSVNFDGITGTHLIQIDTSDDTVAGFWVTGSDYMVRIEGTTIDGATINACVGTFSIENRFQEVDVTRILGHLLTQTGTQLADGFEKFFDVATPTGTVNSLPGAIPGAAGGLLKTVLGRDYDTDLKSAAFAGGMVWVDDAGTASTAWPYGTAPYPTDTIARGKTIADANAITQLRVKGLHTLAAAMEAYNFLGGLYLDATEVIDLGGFSVEHSSFRDLVITGICGNAALIGDQTTYTNCYLYNLTNIHGWVNSGRIEGACSILDTGYATIANTLFGSGIACTLTVQAPTQCDIENMSGELTLAGMDGGVCSISMARGSLLTINNTCTGGTLTVTGAGIVTDNSAGTTVTIKVNEADIVQVGSDAQSLADLKDLVDTGYDPVAHKVQGVVLTDTTTTNTDMRGTDGANTTVPDAAGTAAALHVTSDALIATAQADLDIITGTDGVTLATAQALYAPAKAGDAMTLSAGAVTAAVIAANAIDADAIASNAVTEIQSGLATSASLATAQGDLDLLTGADGATLASLQPNYAPNTVVPDAAGTAATPAEVATALNNYDAPTKAEMDTAHGLLATNAKVLKYIQLLARSDAAIETDNATELTAINADGGSGAGNFSSQTDAVEAIRDVVALASALVTVQNDLDIITGADGVTLATAQGNYAPAKAGDAMTLSAGAVTAAVIATDAIDADAIKADAITEIQSGLATAASVAALNDLSAADVNAQVSDVIKTDTYTLPGQGAPTATPTLEEAIMYLYKFLTNKRTDDGTNIKIYNRGGSTVDHKNTVSDDAVTYTHGEFGTGP